MKHWGKLEVNTAFWCDYFKDCNLYNYALTSKVMCYFLTLTRRKLELGLKDQFVIQHFLFLSFNFKKKIWYYQMNTQVLPGYADENLSHNISFAPDEVFSEELKYKGIKIHLGEAEWKEDWITL